MAISERYQFNRKKKNYGKKNEDEPNLLEVMAMMLEILWRLK